MRTQINKKLNQMDVQIVGIQMHKPKNHINQTTVYFVQTEQVIVRNIQYSEKEKENQKIMTDRKSALSNNRKKVPEDMKNFLKQKRLLTGIDSRQNSIRQQKRLSISQKKSINLNNTQQFFFQSQKNNKINNTIQRQQALDNEEIQKKVIQSKQTFQKLQMKEKNKIKSQQNNTHQICTVCLICEGLIQPQMQKQFLFNCCKHIYCYNCTKSYLQYKIKRFQLIICPNQNCQQILNVQSDFFNGQFKLKLRKRYLRLHNFHKVQQYNHQTLKNEQQNHVQIILCPRQNCQGVIKVNLQKSKGNYQTCPKCLNRFCSKCFSEKIHGEDQQCQNYQTQFMRETLGLMQCSKCKIFIQKIQGCKHISCKCGYQFCQVCNEEWKQGHICKNICLNLRSQGSGGCQWGITTKDHFYFIIKLPMKVILIIGNLLIWAIISFIAFPLNIMAICYWIWLTLFHPTIQKIKIQEENVNKLLMIIFYPLLIFWNIKIGFIKAVEHIDSFLPQLSNSFRYIIRL